MFKIFKQMGTFIKNHRKNYIIAFTLLVVTDLFALIIPWMVGYLTDGISHKSLTLNMFWPLAVGLLLSVLFFYVANYWWTYLIYTGSDRIVRDLRIQLMLKFLRQSPGFFQENTAGSLLSKTMNDSEAVENFAGWGIMVLADGTLYPLALLFVMSFGISWSLTLISVIPLLLIFQYFKRIGAKLFSLSNDVQQSYEELYNLVLENIAGIRLSRAYRMEEQVEIQFQNAVQNTYEKSIIYKQHEARIAPFNRICSSISMIISLVFGSHLISQGNISLGQLISFNIYLCLLVWPMMAIGEYINISQQGSASMERIQELLSYQEEYRDVPDAIVYEGNGDYCFENFNFKYPTSLQNNLSEISFTLKTGQTLGIVGKTASGKTTLLKQFLHLYPLRGDQLCISGTPIWAYQLNSLRAHSAYVPQEHSLFSLSIRDNVRLVNPGLTDGQVDLALKEAELLQDLKQFPEGAETIVGERGITLSGGQKQRLAIARALVGNPELLILDDCLSAVDSETEQRILKRLKEKRANKTTVIAAHRFSALTHADLILV